jgi:F-type H+-transporting ATPase subunit epsilon
LTKSSFRCRLITPEAQVLNDEAVQAIIPCWDGLLGVLPNRAPMVMQLGTGELRVDFADQSGARGGTRSFFVDDGFVQMLDNMLTILAARAVGAEKLSESEAQAELASLNARKTEDLSGEELDRLNKDRARAEAKLQAAKRFRVKGAF